MLATRPSRTGKNKYVVAAAAAAAAAKRKYEGASNEGDEGERRRDAGKSGVIPG
jgi:hypothetical protein